jgi:hypothetical protein
MSDYERDPHGEDYLHHPLFPWAAYDDYAPLAGFPSLFERVDLDPRSLGVADSISAGPEMQATEEKRPDQSTPFFARLAAVAADLAAWMGKRLDRPAHS